MASVTVGANAAPATAEANWLDELVAGECPDLFVLAVQGTGESSPDAPVKADTGMLGTLVSPLLDQARQLGATIDRAYIPYPAAFGGAVPGGKESYATSVTTAQQNLSDAAAKVLSSCGSTKLAVLGYSQGGHAASNFLEEVGAGHGSVPATAIASAALFGSPTRSPAAGVFPGTSQNTPSPVPGTGGEAVRALPAAVVAAASGSGIGPLADQVSDFGALSGRVSMWCQTGDLACDAPADAPIARAVVNVAGQAEIGGDPLVAVQTIGLSLASTAFNFGVDFINEDIQAPGNALANLSINPRKSISQRLADASDPRATPPAPQEAFSALMKIGTIAFNAAVTVAKKVITPDTIAAVAAVGLANPAAAFAVIGGKVLQAVVELVPPATTQRLVKQTFDLVTKEVTTNKDLFDLASLTKYANVQASHTSYGTTPATATGLAPTAYVVQMLAAAAADIHNGGTGTQQAIPSTTAPTTTPRPTSPVVTSPTTTSMTAGQPAPGVVSATDSSTEGNENR